ncbi:MAG: hypothetical protein AB7U82_25795 [Blastocatellales bacterium]
MAYPEPNSLDDIYGHGAEDADSLAEYAEEELAQCGECGHTWPVSELEDGVCPDCLLERHYEARRHREEYERIVDGDYEISDADSGL